MGCPFHSGGDSRSDAESSGHESDGESEEKRRERGIDRRSFVKSALAIGGASALSAVSGLSTVSTAAADRSTASYADRSNRQHAWDAYEQYLPNREQTKPPAHHLLLHVDLQGKGTPSPGHRQSARRAFDSLEETFGWHPEGVLFTVGYSPAYFDRFREDDDDIVMPDGLDPNKDGGIADKQGLIRPEPLIKATTAPHEDPQDIAADTYDAVIHLASDDAVTLLRAEEALWGNGDVDLDATLEGVFTKPTEYPDRRVGFTGHDNLEEMPEFDQIDTGEGEDGLYPEDIPEEDEYGEHPAAELSMGFNDLYKNSIPRETNATILEDQRLVEPKPPGMFAQGSIMHVSKLNINIEDWYGNNDLEERRAQMFSPQHTADNTGVVGEELGNSNAPANDENGGKPMRDASADTDVAAETVTDAKEHGVAGHAQKLARARFSLETRIREDEKKGQERLSGGDRDELLPAEERDDELPGHDGNQELEQVVLRRDFDAASLDQAGNHFVALMRFNPYMAYLRAAMNGVDFDTASFGLTDDERRLDHESVFEKVTGENKSGFVNDDGKGNKDNGIVPYLTTMRRGNYLVPPLTQRALPHPRGEEVDITVMHADGKYSVTVDGVTAGSLEDGSVRFGWFYDVNRARGAEPTKVSQRGGRTTFVFDAEDTGIDTAPAADKADKDDNDIDKVRVRFYAKRKATGRAIRGTAKIEPQNGDDMEEDESESDEKGRGKQAAADD